MSNVEVSEFELSQRLAKELGASLGGEGLAYDQLVILPRHLRNGHLYYDDEDIESLQLARSVDLDITALGGKDREYLHEFSAGWTADIALAIGANLTSDSILMLARFLYLKARSAVSRGLHAGPPSQVPLRVQATRVLSDGQASDTRSVSIEGPADQVLRALGPALAGIGVTAGEGLELPPELTAAKDDSQSMGDEA